MRGLSRLVATALLALLCSNGVAHAQWLLLGRKAVGVVRQMTAEPKAGQSAGYDSATVLLDARASDVYRKAIEIVNASQEYHLTQQNDGALTLEISDGKTLTGLQVNPLEEHLSQLLIVSNATPAQRSGSSLVVNGVLRICREMAIHCELPAPSGG